MESAADDGVFLPLMLNSDVTSRRLVVVGVVVKEWASPK